MKKRLSVFQITCLRLAAAKVYEVGKWIVTILLHHALPLEKRSVNGKEGVNFIGTTQEISILLE
jgi:hypothetical protein